MRKIEITGEGNEANYWVEVCDYIWNPAGQAALVASVIITG